MRANQYPPLLPELVLIPFWISESLYRNNLTIKECLDYEQVKKVVSTEDLASFYNCQTLLSALIGTEDIMLTSNLQGLWERSIPLDRPLVTADQQKFVEEMCPVYGSLSQTCERLFGEDRKVDRYQEAFKIVDLGEKLVGVVIHPGFFGKSTVLELQATLVQSILEAFNMYNSYDEVATSPIFKRHLQLLDSLAS